RNFLPHPSFVELVRHTVMSGVVRARRRDADLTLLRTIRYRSLYYAISRPANFESSRCRASQLDHTGSRLNNRFHLSNGGSHSESSWQKGPCQELSAMR